MQDSSYLSKGALFLVLSIVLGYACDYAFNLTLSRHLPVHEYGDYKVAYAFVTLMSVLVLLGGDRLAPRILAHPIAERKNDVVMHYVALYLKLAFSLSLAVIAVTWFCSYWLVWSFEQTSHHALAYMTLAIPIIAVGAILSRVLQSAKQVAAANLPWRIALPAAKTICVVLLGVWVTKLTLLHVIVSGIAVVCVISVYQVFKLRQLGLLTLNLSAHNKSSPSPSELDRPQLLRLSIPMMLAMLITIALNQVDIFMLELLSHEHSVGHFGAANTLVHLIPVAQVTIASLYMPLIGRTIDKDPNAAAALFGTTQKITVISTVFIAVILFWFSSGLLTHFGPSYKDAEPALIWLTIGYSLWACVAPTVTWQQYQGIGNRVVYIGMMAIVVDILANAWFIPRLGIVGAAISTAIALGFSSVFVIVSALSVRRINAETNPSKA